MGHHHAISLASGVLLRGHSCRKACVNDCVLRFSFALLRTESRSPPLLLRFCLGPVADSKVPGWLRVKEGVLVFYVYISVYGDVCVCASTHAHIYIYV